MAETEQRVLLTVEITSYGHADKVLQEVLDGANKALRREFGKKFRILRGGEKLKVDARDHL